MRSPLMMAAALVVTAAMSAPVLAQRQRWPDSSGQEGGEATPRTAVPRSQPEPPAAAPAPPPRPASPGAAPVAAQADDGQRRAQPRGGRPRGDNPQTGVAVPRPAGRPPRVDDRVYAPGRVYRPYYYYPRYAYPYGYSFGLGYFYYDPYGWYPDPYWYGRPGGYGYGYATGELRLRMRPREAEVFVDGYYAGIVDDFDGTFQALRLEEGPYTIEIRAPGYEPLKFDVRIQPGRKLTYRQDLRPAP